jgi:outer membrane protein assembly factor BamB
MSTSDTDYTIVIKGKPPEARQAAADYISLLLNPWRPDRSDMKTQVKIEVFRNEMHSRGFLEPVELAQEAAQFFPGILITIEGRSQTGNIDEAFQDEGKLPEAPFDEVVVKVLSKLVADVDSDSKRHQWIEPLLEWSKEITLGKAAIKQLKEQFKITEVAANIAAEEEKLQEENEELARQQKEKEAGKLIVRFQEQLKWSYNPISSLTCVKVGDLGLPFLADQDNRPNRFIHIPIKVSKTPEAKRILDSIKKGEEQACFIKSPKGTKFVFPLDNHGLYERKDAVDLCFYFFEGNGFDLDMFSKIIEGSELFFSELVTASGALKSSDKTPQISREVVTDTDGIYVTSQLPDGLFLQKLDETGNVTLSVPMGMNSSWGMCMGEDRIYLSGGSSVAGDPYCITAVSKDGTIAWKIDLPSNPDRTSSKYDFCKIMGASSELFVYCLNNNTFDEPLIDSKNLVAVDPQNGKRLWDREIAQQPSALAMDAAKIYVTDSTHIHAFDHQGGFIWRRELPEISIPADKYDMPVLGLALDGKGNMFVSLNQTGVAGMSCEDGKTLWTLQIEKVISSVVIGSDGISYLTSDGDDCTRVHAVDSEKGTLIWTSEIPDSPGHKAPLPSPTITERGLLIATEERITLLDKDNGSEIWVVANEFPFPLNSAMRLIPRQKTLLCNSYSNKGEYRLPQYLACLANDFGTLTGPWPIAGGNSANSNYLPTAQKGGFKEFITEWREGKPVAPRLSRLNPEFKDESQIGSHVHGIIRGRELLKNAREWAEPEIGQGPSATYRGLQWKLVMAYSGIELLVKSLTAKGKGGLGSAEVEALVSKLPLTAMEPIPSPSLDRKPIKAWLEELDQDAALDFLKTDKGDRSQIQSWLFDQKPCATWTDALLLAKALRNCTAHGALSPNKVQEWGLAEAFKQLPQAVFKIDAAIFEVLGR